MRAKQKIFLGETGKRLNEYRRKSKLGDVFREKQKKTLVSGISSALLLTHALKSTNYKIQKISQKFRVIWMLFLNIWRS